MKTFEKVVRGFAVGLGFLFIAGVIYVTIWLMMLYPMPVHAEECCAPATAIELPLAGRRLTEDEFCSQARKALYAQDWDVVSCAAGVAVGKRYASHALGFGTTPINDRLQWDEAANTYAYRVELRLAGDRLVIGYASSWGATSDKMLRELRKELAERLY